MAQTNPNHGKNDGKLLMAVSVTLIGTALISRWLTVLGQSTCRHSEVCRFHVSPPIWNEPSWVFFVLGLFLSFVCGLWFCGFCVFLLALGGGRLADSPLCDSFCPDQYVFGPCVTQTDAAIRANKRKHFYGKGV